MVFLAEDLALTVSALLHLAQKFKKKKKSHISVKLPYSIYSIP